MATAAFTPQASSTSNPFLTDHLALIQRLLDDVRRVPANPGSFWTPGDFREVANYVRAISKHFDGWLSDIGHELRQNGADFDRDLFVDTFSKAIEGNETHACEEAALALIEDREAA